MNVRDLMAQAVRCNRERIALIHGDRRLTFGEAWERGIRLANLLLSRGALPGDRIGSLEDNGISAADLIQACAIANLTRVPLYARNSAEAHVHMLANTQCKLVIVDAHYAGEMLSIRGQLPDLVDVIVRDAEFDGLLAESSSEMPSITIDPDDYYVIRHTGGTTGKPKAVAYSHRSWLAACRDWFYIFPQVLAGDRCLHVGPISHGSGYQYLPIWFAGGCNVLMDHFSAEAMVEIIERERVAFCQVAATMLRAILDHPGSVGRDYSSLKCMLVGTAPIHERTARAARELMGDILYQGYGQTEVLPVAFMGPAQWFADVPGSQPINACGMVMPFALVEVWDENNHPVPTGDIGEIVAKADGQMTSFWNNPEETAERIVDGWIKTGDIGRLDANGYLYLVDRATDMIVSGGYNIWPLDLERVIAAHPDIIEVAVFGVPHAKWGETPLAVCVVRDGYAVSEQHLITRVAEELGSYMKPSRVVFQLEPLVRSAVGKVNRKALREPYWMDVDRRVSGS